MIIGVTVEKERYISRISNRWNNVYKAISFRAEAVAHCNVEPLSFQDMSWLRRLRETKSEPV